MIFLFGIKRNLLVRDLLDTCECPNCHKNNNMMVTKYGSYFHVFFVPIIPVGSSLEVQCLYCQKIYDGQYLSPTLSDAVQRKTILNETKRPIWHSLGCFVILALFFLIVILFFVALFKVKYSKG